MQHGEGEMANQQKLFGDVAEWQQHTKISDRPWH